MATPTIPNGEEHFFPIIYEGNGGGQRVGQFVPFDDSSGGTIANSCIFNRADSAFLSRTPSSSSTSQRTFTISFWLKRGTALGTNLGLFAGDGANDNNGLRVYLSTSNEIGFSYIVSNSNVARAITTRTLEDTSKWYHIMCVADTTQATDSDRWKIYIDGDLQAVGSTVYPTQNYDVALFGSTSYPTTVARALTLGGSSHLDGYLAEYNVVDGQSLLPASFGVTDTSTGRWIPAQVKPHPTTTTTYTVTVVGGNPSNHPYYNVGSTNKFAINGSTATADVDLTLYEGATYRFDQSDSSNSGHPLRFSTVAHGTHASGGTEYTTNVTVVGTAGTSGAYTEITVASSAPDLHYYCTNHNGMGYQASTPSGYGTNGFRLTFSDSSSLGADTSGNSNTFTATNLSASDQTTDSPTQNHATFDPSFSSSSMLLSDGNLTVTDNANANYESAYVGMPVKSGKYYFEITIVGSYHPRFFFIGVNNFEAVTANKNQYPGYADGSASFLFHTSADSIYYGGNNYVNAGSSTTLAQNDKIGVAYDADTGAFWVAKNNSWLYSGNPSTGANPLFSGITAKQLVYFSIASWYSTSVTSTNFGQRSFAYTPPTGFVALQQDNLPETAKGVSGFSWIKNRDTASNHQIYDSSRGAGKLLMSSATNAESTRTDALYKFLKGGYAVGDNSSINGSGDSIVAWNWQANGGTTASNGNGSITSTVQANTTAGFSIVQYTGTGSNATVGHGLSSAPEWILFKNLDNASEGWSTYHTSLTSATYILTLNNTNAQASSATDFNSTAPTSTVLSVGTNARTNASGVRYIAYCWHSVEGFSKFGKYTGNGSTDGTFVYIGFKPAWLMVKNISGSYNWVLWDNKRTPINPIGTGLLPNGTNADTTGFDIDFLSNGFKLRDSETTLNASGNTIIYMAFAEHPFVGDGTSPVTAR